MPSNFSRGCGSVSSSGNCRLLKDFSISTSVSRPVRQSPLAGRTDAPDNDSKAHWLQQKRHYFHVVSDNDTATLTALSDRGIVGESIRPSPFVLRSQSWPKRKNPKAKPPTFLRA